MHTLAQSLAISHAQLRSRQEPEPGRQPEDADGDQSTIPTTVMIPSMCVPETVVAEKASGDPDVAQPGQDIAMPMIRPPPP